MGQLKPGGQATHPKLKSWKLRSVTKPGLSKSQVQVRKTDGTRAQAFSSATASTIQQSTSHPWPELLRDKTRGTGDPLGAQRQDPVRELPGKHLPTLQMEGWALPGSQNMGLSKPRVRKEGSSSSALVRPPTQPSCFSRQVPRLVAKACIV